jgi:hypothetical protein
MFTKSLLSFASVAALLSAVACSSSPNGVVAPSSIAPSVAGTEAGGGGGTVRYYAPTAAQGTINAGSNGNSVSVTLLNCNGTGPCGSSITSDNQKIGSATVDVPSGFTVNPASVSVSASGGKQWSATFSAGTITLLAGGGTDRLDKGESLTVSFSVNAPCTGGSYTLSTHAYQDTTLPSLTSYQRVGNDAAIFVTGNCTTVCAQGLGYWKQANAWPVSSLTLGTVSYSESELRSILNAPAVGNGLIILAHQLIAAKLNQANGADVTSVAATIAAADTLIGGLVAPPVGSGTLAPASTDTLANTLDTFNNGCSSGS